MKNVLKIGMGNFFTIQILADKNKYSKQLPKQTLVQHNMASIRDLFMSIYAFFVVHVLSAYGKLIGYLCRIHIPRPLRKPLLQFYAWYTSSRTYEMKKGLEEYRTLHEFFIREIKERPIDAVHELVAPVDCTVTATGRLSPDNDWKITQIKGIDYPLEHILGCEPNDPKIQSLKMKDNVFFCTIHLPPNECHRFRSPADVVFKRRTLIPGTMFELNSNNLFRHPHVLYNERVILEGKWQYGNFYFIPFGSKTVGSIVLDFDKSLKTNVIFEKLRKEEPDEKLVPYNNFGVDTQAHIKDYPGEGIHLKKGQEFGHFEGGSAFVVIFEHQNPKFEFSVQAPQYILYGNALCN